MKIFFNIKVIKPANYTIETISNADYFLTIVFQDNNVRYYKHKIGEGDSCENY